MYILNECPLRGIPTPPKGNGNGTLLHCSYIFENLDPVLKSYKWFGQKVSTKKSTGSNSNVAHRALFPIGQLTWPPALPPLPVTMLLLTMTVERWELLLQLDVLVDPLKCLLMASSPIIWGKIAWGAAWRHKKESKNFDQVSIGDRRNSVYAWNL